MMIDFSTALNDILSNSPFFALMAYFLYREQQRANKWETTYLKDSAATIATLTTVAGALTDIKQELRK